MEIEVKIEPYSSSLNYYVISWRHKKKINFFNAWMNIVEVYDGYFLYYDHPIMFSDFDQAVEYGNKLKENPELIAEHYKIQDEIYQKSLERRKKEKEGRNRTIII